MKFVLKMALIIPIISITFIGCTKEEDPEPVKTKTQLLTANDWVMTNIEAAPPLDTINLWAFVPPCQKDDFYTFKSDGNGTFDVGSNKCEGITNSTFTWKWLDNETTLEMILVSQELSLKDVNVTSTTLSGISETYFGIPNVTLTFSKK